MMKESESDGKKRRREGIMKIKTARQKETEINRLARRRRTDANICRLTCQFFLSLLCCCSEPAVQIESYKSLKLVRNLRGIIVLAIRVIDCLDALSGCIISLWLRLGLGSDPGAK